MEDLIKKIKAMEPTKEQAKDRTPEYAFGYIAALNQAVEIVKLFALADVINWVAFDWMKIETRPTKYGKYLITRKDGKIHWETWNGSGWAYNHNEIRYWAEIKPPCL